MSNLNKISLFLDSGAFSAWSKGIEININDYIHFIKEHEQYIDVYANLDSIGNPEKTLQNQKVMEEAGLSPLPCFHYGEDIKYLKYYLRYYQYIALGGMVPISNTPLVKWLDNLFISHICNQDGSPKVKVHGFGLTSVQLMIRYPWYSVDSTSWVLTGRFGAVYVPKMKNGNYDYLQIPYKVIVSDKSPSQKQEGKHINTFSGGEKRKVLEYFEEKGYCLEGLSSEYKKRDELNIIYFLDLEKALPEWPWAFKVKKAGNLGLV